MNMPAIHVPVASSPVSLCAWYLARALTEARAIKASADALAKAQEHLAAARRHYCKAKARGASADVLAQLVADGHTVAAEVKAAEGRVSERAAQLAAKAEAKVKRDVVRLRMQRDYILKGTTGEAARHAASTMAGRGLFADPPTALAALVSEVVKTVAREAATPEHILQAWMVLDPSTK